MVTKQRDIERRTNWTKKVLGDTRSLTKGLEIVLVSPVKREREIVKCRSNKSAPNKGHMTGDRDFSLLK